MYASYEFVVAIPYMKRLSVPAKLSEDAAVEVMLKAGLRPIEPYPGSSKPWRSHCMSCGEEVKLSIVAARRGGGCAFCAGRRIRARDAVATMERAGFSPLEPFPGAGRPWPSRCDVCDRESSPRLETVSRGTRCRYCAGVATDQDDAVKTMLAADLDPVTPYPGAGRPWASLCMNCRRQVAPTLSSVKKGGGCKFCSRRATVVEDAINEFRSAGLEPIDDFRGVDVPWPSRCMTCDRSVQPTLTNVRRRGRGCKFCSSKNVSSDAATAVFRARGLELLEAFDSTRVPIGCRCVICGLTSKRTYRSVSSGYGCRGCAELTRRQRDEAKAHRLLSGTPFSPIEPYPGRARPWALECTECDAVVYLSRQQLHSPPGCKRHQPAVNGVAAAEIMRSAGMEPIDPYPGANVPWPVTCIECGKASRPRLQNVIGGSRCKHCAARRRGERRRKFDSNTALKIMHDAGFQTHGAFGGVDAPWKALCTSCGAQSTPTLRRVLRGSRCVFCSGRRVREEDAIGLMQRAGLEPVAPYPGSSKPWSCRCTNCGMVVTPLFMNVRRGQGGCVQCAGRYVDPQVAIEVMRTAGLEPIDAYPGSDHPWRSTCLSCMREVAPRFGHVRTRRRGCRYCSVTGYKYAEPAFVYLISHPALSAHKIGIAGMTSRRLDLHRGRGWQVYATLSFETGHDAFVVEQSVLSWIRNDLHLPPYLADCDGWTESVDAEAISLPQLWRQVLATASL